MTCSVNNNDMEETTMSETKKTAIVFFPTDATPSNYEYAHEF